MALRATIGADFSEFSAALKSVGVQLKGTGDLAKNTGRDLSKIVEGFSGSAVMRQADLIAEGLRRIEQEAAKSGRAISGVSTLTEAEQRKVNAAVTEAIAKYKALGQQVPPDLQRIADETAKVGAATTQAQSGAGGLLGKLGPLGPMIATTFSVGAVMAFGKELLSTADATVKMADKTGMTIEAVQRLTFVAAQSGNTLEQVSGAVSMLQKRLAEGDQSAVGALRQLGIEHERFMAMSPDQQFLAVARAVKDIEDPMQRAKVATELFGRAGTELLPTLIANVDELAAQAPVMSERATKAFDSIGDSISRLTSKLKVMVGEGLASAMDAYGRLAQGVGQVMSGQFAKAAETLLDLETELPRVATQAKGLAVATTSVALSMQEADEVGKDLTDTLKEHNKSTAAAESSARKAADAWAKLQTELYEIEKIGAGASLEVYKFGRVLDEAGDTAEAVKNFEALRAKLYEIEKVGAGASLEVWKFGQVIDEAGESAAMGKAAGERAAESWGAGFQKIAKGFPDLMVAAFTGSGSWMNAFGAMGSQVGELIGTKIGASLGKSIGGWLGKTVASILPGIGSMLGPAIEWLGNKLFKVEGKKVNDLRDAFIAAAGGLDALNKKAHDAGMTLNGLLKAKTVKDYETAVASLNTALAKTAALQGELAGLQAELAGRQVMDWQQAQQLIEKYGGTLGNLGQQFTAAKQAANWKAIWDDWQTLIDMGADVGGVLVSMKDEISALVQESLRVGTEIPEQFRPLIEELIRTGQLLDENGNAITDLGQLKFGAPLVSEVDKIIKKIDELIAALTNGLTGALNEVGRMKPEVTIHAKYEVDDFPDVSPDVPGYARGTGGFVDFGAGTLAMLHGYEAVVPRGQAAPSSSGAAASRDGRGGRDAAPVNVAITIQALDPIGLKQVVEKDVVPLLVSAYRRNVNGARTDTRKELVE